jgi:hypothetical protein
MEKVLDTHDLYLQKLSSFQEEEILIQWHVFRSKGDQARAGKFK